MEAGVPLRSTAGRLAGGVGVADAARLRSSGGGGGEGAILVTAGKEESAKKYEAEINEPLVVEMSLVAM